jgi:hypothetical protein
METTADYLLAYVTIALQERVSRQVKRSREQGIVIETGDGTRMDEGDEETRRLSKMTRCHPPLCSRVSRDGMRALRVEVPKSELDQEFGLA